MIWGQDIDRNITRQLWEKNKNVFTRNDVIPVENGGTGVTNTKDIVSIISNGTQYIKTINNTYKNEKINKVINSSIVINSNSINNATITLYDGTITISIESSTDITTLNTNNYGNFLVFHYKRRYI